MCKSLTQNAAGQVPGEFKLDVLRQPAFVDLPQLGEKGGQVRLHGLVKDSLLRLAAMITTRQSGTGVARPSLVNMLLLRLLTPHAATLDTKAVPDREFYKDQGLAE